MTRNEAAKLDMFVEAIAALRRELKLTWEAHAREHVQHEQSHAREHAFSQQAIDTAAVLSRENKSDANEWRASMTDREIRFATKDDVGSILQRLDSIERADILSVERDRQRVSDEAEERRQTERRQSRQQWVVGIMIGLMATFGAIMINLVLWVP